MKEKMWHSAFCAWVTSLSIFSMSTHFFAIFIYFFFTNEWNSTVYNIFIIYSWFFFFGGHLGYFHFPAIMKRAAMNVAEQCYGVEYAVLWAYAK